MPATSDSVPQPLSHVEVPNAPTHTLPKLTNKQSRLLLQRMTSRSTRSGAFT